MQAELIEFMGDDLRVVNAARVSFDNESKYVEVLRETDNFPLGLGLDERDQKLIKYLATHNHWTPFSHVMITMRETVPIFVARQRFKHMVGFTYNEVSRRYVDDEPEFYFPDTWRRAAENKKQGSSDETIELWTKRGLVSIEGSTLQGSYEMSISYAKKVYFDMIAEGVAPEQARMVLPQSMYTSYYCTGSLAAWARAYKLRSDPHAQKEIQDLAEQWHKIIGGIPELQHSWRALTDKKD